MTYTGQWLTDIVTKHFFQKKNCMGNHWLDWHCDQGIFNKHLWHIQDNDWLTLWPNIFFKKKICMGNHWLDWHCDQGIFNKHLWHIQDNDWLTLWPNIFFQKKKIVWETIDLTDIVTKVYLINIYDIYRTMTDWHCDQTFFFKKKKLYGKPLTWLTLWPRYI